MQARFTDKRLKFRITQDEILNLQLHEESNHALRHSQNNGITFEHGAGGFEQFISEFYTRATRMNGLQHLGYPETFRPDQEEFPGMESIKTQLAALLKIVNITADDIDHIIAAHSQGPLGVIPFILGHAIHEPKNEKDRILFKQPHSQQINFYREADKPLFARVQLDYFPIANYEGNTIGILPGPVEITYTIIQTNISHDYKPDMVWGYKLEYIESSNPDIVKAIKDKKFDPAAIKQCYCGVDQILDFKRMAIMHAEALYEIDRSNHFIHAYVTDPEIEEIHQPVSDKPSNSKLSLFSRIKQVKNDTAQKMTEKFCKRK